MKFIIIIWVFMHFCTTLVAQISVDMVRIKGGSFTPFLNKDSIQVMIKDFSVDVYPVTNLEYKQFLEKYPNWQRSKVKGLYADAAYLRHWNADLDFKTEISNSPVTYVSWFAAKAYCECQNKRLPTADEWDYLSLASETKANGSADKHFNQYILDWYSRPNPEKYPSVKKSFRNYYGVYGVHGLVWEWVLDFNSSMLMSESRTNASAEKDLFCGGGAEQSQDRQNYVAFMRYAFRSSLKGNYTVSNLGFRCAKSLNE